MVVVDYGSGHAAAWAIMMMIMKRSWGRIMKMMMIMEMVLAFDFANDTANDVVFAVAVANTSFKSTTRTIYAG